MNKIILRSVLIFIFWNSIYSQEDKLSPNLLTFPVSPEAGKLGTYGNLSVNLSSGQLNKDIELFTGVVSDYKIPINLSYNYGGNRMEEEPSIVGLGWQLNMGGVVTREVRALPDETLGFGYFDSTIQNLLNPYFTSGTINDNTSKEIASGHLDTEVDKYHLNVNGINFSFKIGFNGQPVFLSSHNYKLEIVRGPNPPNAQNTNQKEIINFILTDTNSNQYHFSHREFTEIVDGDDYFNAPLNYPSSWQLSRIVLNNGSVIEYNYQDDIYKTKSFYGNLAVSAEGLIPDVDNYSEGFTVYNISRKLLTSISSNNFSLTFGITILNNQKVYNKITVKDFVNSNILVYDLSYNDKRNCLTKINKNGQFFYEFEYNAINEPFVINDASYVKSQDYWGFCNGANNSYFVNGPGNSQYKSNRNPNFTRTVEGAMTKITYPTKGSTIIDYEQNSVPFLNSESSIEPNVEMNLKFKSDNTYSDPSHKEVVVTKTFTTDVVAELDHIISNVNYVSVSIKCINSDKCTGSVNNPNYYNELAGSAILPTICLSLNDIAQIDGCTKSDCSVSRSSGKKFKIYQGTYEFKISTDYNYLNLDAGIILKYYDASLDSGTISKSEIGGIRVKSTTDIDPNLQATAYYYDYDYDDTLSKVTVQLSSQHSYTYGLHPYTVHPPSGWLDPKYYGTGIPVTHYSKTGFNIFSSSDGNGPVFYKKVREARVIEYVFVPISSPFNRFNTGKNWDNTFIYTYLGPLGTLKKNYPQGYKETIFEKPYSVDFDYPFAPGGKDLSGPREMSSSIFSKSDSNYVSVPIMLQSSEFFNLNSINLELVNNPNSPKSLKVGYIFDRGNIAITIDRSLSTTYRYQTYRDNDYNFFKFQINNKEYFYNQIVETNKKIDYDSHNQQHLITTSDSQNNVKTTEIFYPYDFNDAISNDMVSKNAISPIVQIINKNNGTLTDSYKYDYTAVTANLFKPGYFSESKNNAVFEKKKQYQYDGSGNIIQIGSIIKYDPVPRNTITDSNTMLLWGYNKSQILAKIEYTAPLVIPSNLITAIETASNSGNESSLLTALSNLRNDSSLSNIMVTTYTYIPLVGVSTITDPKGDKTTYTYDIFGRLEFVKDKNNNILSKNQYHYKQ